MTAVQRVLLEVDAPQQVLFGPTARRLARAVFEAADPFGLLVFRASARQLDLLVSGSGELARVCARHLRICLRHRFDLGFASVRVAAVSSGEALRWQTLSVLRGPREPDGDVLGDASNLPELLGLRVMGRSTRIRLARLLPDLPRAALERLLPAGAWGAVQPQSALLPDAAAAAVCITSFDELGSEGERARAAASLAASRLGLRSPGPVPKPGAERRLLGEATGPELVQAVVAQLRVRSALVQRRGQAELRRSG